MKMTRRLAKLQGLSKYNSGKPCIRGHYSDRYAASGTCCACYKLDAQRDKEKRQEANTEWYRKNKDKNRKKTRKWQIDNPDKVAEHKARRRAQRIKACPKWVDYKKILEIYREAKRRSKAEGITYHVDHIVPLRNKNVCGLHVPWNLRIITAEENILKGNKLIDDLITNE